MGTHYIDLDANLVDPDDPNPESVLIFQGQRGTHHWRYLVYFIVRPPLCIRTGADSDGDGLLDDWEINGYDSNCDGRMDLGVDVFLPQMGASPTHKDIFIELKWYDGYRPSATAVDQVRQAFSRAPADSGGILNPDGQLGINVIFDAGDLRDYNPALLEDDVTIGSCTDGIDNDGDGVFDANDTDCMSFIGNNLGSYSEGGEKLGDPDIYAPESGDDFVTTAEELSEGSRRGIFRFIHFGPMYKNGAGGVTFGANSDFMYLTRRDGSCIMHEMGHSFGLQHGGYPYSKNCKPNHISVMNYIYGNSAGIQWRDPNVNGGALYGFIDYAPSQIPDERIPANLRLPVLPNVIEFNHDEEGVLVEKVPTTNPRVQLIYSPNESTYSEDGAGPNTCGDGIDNGGDGIMDDMEPECREVYTREIDEWIDWNNDKL